MLHECQLALPATQSLSKRVCRGGCMFERKNRGRGRGWRRGWGSGWRRGCKPFHVHVYIHLTRMKVRKWIHMGEEGWVGLCSMMSPTTKFVYTEKGGPGSTPHHHGPKGTAWCLFSLFFYLEKGLCDQSGTKENRYTCSEKGGNRVSKRVHALFAQQRGPSRTKNKWVGYNGYACDYSRRGTHYQRADMCIGGTLLVFCHGACRTNLADIGLWD